MDVVLGISMGSTAVRMVLVEGENADGATVDEDHFRITATNPQDPATSSAPAQVLSAILGTREGAAEGGYQLMSTGVAWTNPAEAAVLRDALAAYKIQNVMLVSAFLAAAALAQTVGHAIGYRHIAMLLIDPEYATVGIVDSDDGSITEIRREPLQLSRDGADTVAQLVAMIAGISTRHAHPEGVFLVGCGIDIAALKPALDAVTPLRVSAPEEPEMALARGAALASAGAPLSVSSTGALAYAQDPGTGEVDQYPYPLAEYLSAAEISGSEPIAYSGVPDDDADADTTVTHAVTNGGRDETRQRRRPVLLISSLLAVIFISAVLALEVALAINIRTTVALQPSPEQNLIVPTQQAPAPAPTLQAPAANHQLAPLSQPMPNFVAQPPTAPAPALTAPAAPAPALPAPAAPPVPVPVPVAPVPIPISVPAPAAPLPVPNVQPRVNIPVPPVQLPNPPLQMPTAPLQPPAPKPPVQLPSPQPAVQLSTPQPPVQLPAPKPPVQLPTPKPAVQLPAPQPPVQLPNPKPPVQLPAPKPPVQLPNPRPPVQLPVPKAPTAPILPAPVAPRPPVMPAPAMPRAPVMAPHSGI